MLDAVGLEEQRRIDEAVAQVKAEQAREAEQLVTPTPLFLEEAEYVPVPAGPRTHPSSAERKHRHP